MPSLTIDNFSKGMMTDAALDADKIYSFLEFINTDVDYERGASVRRPGYNRHHALLPAVPKQFYEFVDLSGYQNELTISNGKLYWYSLTADVQYEVKNASEATPASLTFSIRDNYPFITVENRCFFADDNGWYWVDNTSLQHVNGSPTPWCYQVGIDKPDFEIYGRGDTTRLSYETYANYVILNITDQQRFWETFTPSNDIVVDAIRVFFWTENNRVPDTTARIIVSLYSVDGSGNPNTLLARSSRTLDDLYHTMGVDKPLAGAGFRRFDLDDFAELTSGTTYGIEIKGDTGYASWYAPAGGAIFGIGTSGYAGTFKKYNGTTWSTIAGQDLLFVVGGGLVEDGEYTYAFTHYNSTYAIESEPLEWVDDVQHKEYVVPSQQNVLFTNLPGSTDDEQVDKKRIYRTKDGGTTFYLVYEIDITETSFWDNIDDDNLGGELQTGGDLIVAKHLRLADTDDNLIIPYLLEIWNGRIWAVKAHSNVLNYSKILEEAGATGDAGDSVYDYFPADNKWTLDSEIRSIRKRGENEFVVYTSNNNVHVFRGSDEPLNPPPDLSHQEMLIGANCMNDRTLQEVRGRHIFLTSDKELKAFNGTVDLEEIVDTISSFLGRTGTKFSSCIYKNQYCLGCDTDSDDVMDSIIIFDLSQPRITNWRHYQYLNSYGASGELMKFYNLHVTRDARMFACPADLDTNDFYVVQLMTGYSDDWTTDYSDGVDITRVIQTQFIIPARRARWSKVELTAFYPHGMFYGTDFYGGGLYGGDETIPTYTIYAIGKSDEFCQTTISPRSSRDISGHVAGIRLLSEECSVIIEDTGDKPDEIRSLTLHWSFN